METDIDVGVLKNRNGLVWLNFAKVDIAYSEPKTAFVVSAGGVFIRGRIVIERFTAVGLFRTARCVGVGYSNGVRCGDAGQRNIAGIDAAAQQRCNQTGNRAEGVAYVEGDAFNAYTDPHVVRGLSKSSIDNNSVRFRIRQRHIERESFHHGNFEVFELLPQRVINVHGADFPLEGGFEPNFRWCWDDAVAGFNAPTLALCGDALNGQSHRDVVRVVAVNVDVIFKQHQIGPNQQFTREGTGIPGLVRRAVVSGGEIHVHGIGVDAKPEEVVQTESIH